MNGVGCRAPTMQSQFHLPAGSLARRPIKGDHGRPWKPCGRHDGHNHRRHRRRRQHDGRHWALPMFSGDPATAQFEQPRSSRVIKRAEIKPPSHQMGSLGPKPGRCCLLTASPASNISCLRAYFKPWLAATCCRCAAHTSVAQLIALIKAQICFASTRNPILQWHSGFGILDSAPVPRQHNKRRRINGSLSCRRRHHRRRSQRQAQLHQKLF